MGRRFRLGVNVTLLVSSILLGLPSAALRGQEVYRVHIGNNSFVPPANGGWPLAIKTRSVASVLPDGRKPVLLQFYDLPSESQRAELAARGARLYDYLGGMAYFATVAPGFRAGDLKGGAVRSVMELAPQWKLSPLLEGGAVPEHARAQDGSARVNVVWHAGVDESYVRSALLKLGLKAEQISPVFRTVSLTIPADRVLSMAAEAWVVAVNPQPARAELANRRGREMNNSHRLSQLPVLGGRGLTGAGVRVGVFDADVEYHVDFGKRVHVKESEMPVMMSNGHGVHVSGTLAGAGILDPRGLGVAPGAELYTYNFQKMSNGLSVSEKMLQAADEYHINITQNSYGVAIGNYCRYYDRFSYNGMEVSWDVDYVVNLEPTLLHVYSVGNDREGKANCGHTYGTSAKRSKNALYVGALDGNGAMSVYSSWGPMDDGRLLPTVVALGTNVYSTRPVNTYGEGTGSSMACPSVSGVAALLTERYRQLNEMTAPLAALMRGVIANTAEDMGAAGPDYQHGYGLVDAERALRTIESKWYFIGEFSSGATAAVTHKINVPANAKELRVMLVWTDTVSNKAHAYGTPALINDLDLAVVKDGASTLPWVLNPARPGDAATRGVDKINNMEQVTIERPAAGEYELKVSPATIASHSQQYALVYWIEESERTIVYPLGGEQMAPGDSFYIRWSGLETLVKVEVSVDDGKSYATIAEKVDGRQLEWAIPASTPSTSTALIRLTDAKGVVKSEQPFSIIGVPQDLAISASECSVDDWKISWNKVENVEQYEVLKADVEEGSFEVIATVSGESAVIPRGKISSDMRNVYTVRSKLNNGAVGRRAKGVLMEAAVPLELTSAKLPFVEHFEKTPSPYVQLIQGKNMSLGYISSYPGITLQPGHHLVTSYGQHGVKVTDWNPEDVFATEENKNRIRMCGVDLSNTGLSELHLTLRVSQLYFHMQQNSSARVLINGAPVPDVNGDTIIQAAEPQDTKVKTLCYDLTPYIGKKINIEIQHVAKDVACALVVEEIRIGAPDASGRIELTDFTTTELVAGASPRNDVRVEVLNNQPKGVETLAVAYRIDDGSMVVESIEGLKPYERRSYTFLTRADLSSAEELGQVFNLSARILHPDTLRAEAHFKAINTGEVYPLAYSPWSEVPFVGLTKEDPKQTTTVNGRLIFTPHRGAFQGYEENQQSTVRFKPSDDSKKLRVLFERFDTEKDADGFYVYNCEVPDNLELKEVAHTELLTGTLTDYELLSCTKGGDITFTFSSDISVSGEGWLAYITEETPVNKFTLAPIVLENYYADEKAPIVVKVRNNTKSEATDVRVAYNVNGSYEWEVGTISSIPAGEEVSYTFPTPAEVPFGGHYNVKARIISQDYDRSDNESSASMTNDKYCHGVEITDHKSLYIKEIATASGAKVSSDQGDGRIVYHQDASMPIHKGSSKTEFKVRTNGPLGAGDVAVLYVDWNADGEFDNATERHGAFTVLPNNTLRFVIDIPSSAATGATRMRVMVGHGEALASACPADILAYGDVRDYKVEILDAAFPINDVAITNIAVKSGVGLSQEEPVTVSLKNYGAEDINSLNITMTVDGATASETASITIPAFGAEEVSYTLQQKIDMRLAGKYKVEVSIPDDQNLENNKVSVTSYSIKSAASDAFYALKFKRGQSQIESLDLGPLGNTPMYASGNSRGATLEVWVMPQEEGRNVVFDGKNIVVFMNTGDNVASEFPRNSLVVQFVADPARPTMSVYTAADAITPNQWQHVAIALYLESPKEPSNFRIYINGERQEVTIKNPSFYCYGEKNAEMPMRAAYDFGGMIRQIRCWSVQLPDSVLRNAEHKYSTLRDGTGALPKGLLAEFTLAEGMGNVATVSGEDVGVIHSERLGSGTDPVWVSPTSLVGAVQLEGQLFPAESTGPNHFTIPIAEGVTLSEVGGQITAAWPGTQLTYNGEPIVAGTTFDFSGADNQISVEASIEPKYIFGQTVASQTYTIKVEKVAPVKLESLSAKKDNNPGLTNDVAASIAPEMRIDLSGITDMTRVKLTFTASPGATLKANGADIVSGSSELNLTSPVELTLISADSRQVVCYMLEAYRGQEIQWAPIATEYTYGAASQNLDASSTSALPIVYTSSNSNVATVNGGQLYITGVGKATLSATQPGGLGWTPAEPKQQTIEVKPKAITVAPKAIEMEELQSLPEMEFTYAGLVNEEHAKTIKLPRYQVIVGFEAWEKAETLIPVGNHVLKPVDAAPYVSGSYEVTPNDGTLEVRNAAEVKVVTFHVCDAKDQNVGEAKVFINQDVYTTDPITGKVAIRLRKGNYSYRVEAIGYVASSETLEVDGADFTHKLQLHQPKYTLSYGTANAEHGKIVGNAEQKVAELGTGEPVYAVPMPGYAFSGWSDGVASNPRTDNNVTEDKAVQALFDVVTFVVSYKAEGQGRIEGEATQTVPYGSKTTPVTAVPDAGYLFVRWSDNHKHPQRVDSAFTDNATFTAFFDRQPTLPYSQDFEGSLELPNFWTSVDEAKEGFPWYVSNQQVFFVEPIAGNSAFGYASSHASLYSPAFPMHELTNTDVVVKFQYKGYPFPANFTGKVQYKTDKTDWTDLAGLVLNFAINNFVDTIRHEAIAGAETLQLRWTIFNGNIEGYPLALDNVAIELFSRPPAPAPAPSPSPAAALSFVVKEESGALQGADVTVEGVGTKATDAAGKVQFDGLPLQEYKYAVSKTGYKAAEGVQLLEAGGNVVTVTLEKIKTPVESALLSGVVVRPNPARRTLHVENTAAVERLSVVSLRGEVILMRDNEEGAPTVAIALGDLAEGMYLLMVERDGARRAIPFSVMR